MDIFLDSREPLALVRHQTFDSVKVDLPSRRGLRAAELVRGSMERIGKWQRDYGHLAGQESQAVAERIDAELTELTRRLRNLR